MENTAAAAAAANGRPPEMMTAPPSQQRGQKRCRDAQENAAAAAFVETEASWFIQIQEVGQDDDEEVRFANQLIDFLGVHLMDDDGDTKAGSSDQDPSAGAAPRMGAASRSGDPAAPPAALDEDGVVRALCNWPLPFFPLPLPRPIRYDVEFAHAADPSSGPASPEDDGGSRDATVVYGIAAVAAAGGNTSAAESAAPSPNANPSGGPFGFDLNQLLPPEDEGFLVVPCNAVVYDCSSTAATAGDGSSVEFAAPDDATTVRRPSSGGLDFDLNEPACPSELLFPDGALDPPDVPEPAPPAPAEDSLAAPDADERPELPDGGGAPVSRTRRRHLWLWDWA